MSLVITFGLGKIPWAMYSPWFANVSRSHRGARRVVRPSSARSSGVVQVQSRLNWHRAGSRTAGTAARWLAGRHGYPAPAQRRAGRLLRRDKVGGFVFRSRFSAPHLDVAQNVAPAARCLQRKPGRTAGAWRADAAGREPADSAWARRLPANLESAGTGQARGHCPAAAGAHRPCPAAATDEPTWQPRPRPPREGMDVLIAQTRLEGASLVLVTHSRGGGAACRPGAAPDGGRHRLSTLLFWIYVK